jgi:hypothetical protein
MSSPKQLGVLNDVRKRRRQLTETLLGQADEFQRIRELEKNKYSDEKKYNVGKTIINHPFWNGL